MAKRGRLLVKRKGYKKKAYVAHRRGKLVKVKASYVPPTRFKIRDIGARGRGPKVVSKIRKGLLKKFGYSTGKLEAVRHKALRKAYRAYGGVSLFRKLQLQVILRKRTQLAARATFAKDRDWVKRTLMTQAEKISMTRPARKKWMAMTPRARAKAMPDGAV